VKFYFDTSIWLDIVLDRGNNGKVAKELLNKIIIFDQFVVYSDAVIFELQIVGLSNFEINNLLSLAKPDNIVRIKSTKEQTILAKQIAKKLNIPKLDVLHAIISRDCGAQLVSRDWDFEKIKNITKTKRPEELI